MTNTEKATEIKIKTPYGVKNWSFVKKCFDAHEALLEACKTAIEATLDGVVGKAIKDGTLLESEMHAGLCLLAFIRRNYLKTYEQAISKAEKGE